MNKTRQLIVHLYAALLRLYPASFRDEFADEMETVFIENICDAAYVNRQGLLLVCWRELRDYPFSLFREHWRHFTNKEPKMMAIYRKPGWLFYPAWIILTALSVPLAFISYVFFIRIIEGFVGDVIYVNGVRHITEDYFVEFIFFPTLSLLMGVFQYGLLRRYLPRMGWWVGVTFIGWIGTFIFMELYYTLLTNWGSTDLLSVSPALNPAGFLVGFAQWLLLRRRLPRAGWWVVANVAGWSVFRLVTGHSMTNTGELLLLGFIPACVNAVTMGLLLHQPRPPKPQGVNMDEALPA